jgi:hypothetical protein
MLDGGFRRKAAGGDQTASCSRRNVQDYRTAGVMTADDACSLNKKEIAILTPQRRNICTHVLRRRAVPGTTSSDR